MGPGHDAFTFRVLRVAALFGGLWAVAAAARAQALPVVRLCDSGDAELVSRVNGQVHDLAVELRWVASTATSASDRDDPAVLAFVCIEPAEQGGYRVHISAPPAAPERVRDVPAAQGEDRLGSSAARETVALVVRGEIAQLLAPTADASATRPASDAAPSSQRTLGTPAAVSSKPQQPEQAGARNGSDAVANDEARDSQAGELPGLPRLSAAAGWDGALAGPDHLAHALALRAYLSFHALELGLSASLGMPATLDAGSLRARVARHAAWLFVGLAVPIGNVIELVPRVRIGGLAFARSTEGSDPGLLNSHAATSRALAFGPELGLRIWPWRVVGFELSVSGDIVPAPPRYSLLRASGGEVTLAHEAWLEPALDLAIVFSNARL